MAQAVKLKKPVVPSAEREAQELKLTADEIIKAIEEGVFDTHLDLIDKAITERIRASQEEDGDEIEPRRSSTEKIRVLRSGPIKLTVGRIYRLRGEKYLGVRVTFLQLVGDAEGGVSKAKILVEVGNENLVKGSVFLVPTGALEEIPEMQAKADEQPYGHSLKNCRKCGGPIEYSGSGRPRVLCENCR